MCSSRIGGTKLSRCVKIIRERFKFPKNIGLDPFPSSFTYFEAPRVSLWILQAVWCCRQCGDAGSAVLQAVLSLSLMIKGVPAKMYVAHLSRINQCSEVLQGVPYSL